MLYQKHSFYIQQQRLQGEDQLVENVKAFVDAVAKAKPSGSKGAYMKGITLSSTMGPGVTISIDKANAQ